MIRLEEILDKVEKHHPGDKLDLIRRAYIFSAKEHKGQVRASGEPYLTHPLEVANLLAEMKMDAVTVGVGLLHDVVEDTLTTLDKIEELFGPEVAHIVDGVTKISQSQFTSKEKKHEAFLAEVTGMVQQKMREHEIPCFTQSRIKRLYSIHLKLKKQRIAIDQVYDLLALRLITDSVKNCYAALGVIHNTWRPVPGRIKDFIAMPRPNMYQSLHTSVIAGGQPFEVQIRTAEMHQIAEEGIAAHWKYKDGKLVADDREDQRVSWLRHLVEWQQEMKDPADFLSTLKIDLYPEEVYTFTPKGRVVSLPRDATPVDFAYAIHTEVGHTCVGAKINNRMTPLRTKLRNGDIVEIITQAGHKPSRDWLSYAKSSRARNKIKHWLNLYQRERAMEIGRKLLEREARKYQVNLKDLKD